MPQVSSSKMFVSQVQCLPHSFLHLIKLEFQECRDLRFEGSQTVLDLMGHVTLQFGKPMQEATKYYTLLLPGRSQFINVTYRKAPPVSDASLNFRSRIFISKSILVLCFHLHQIFQMVCFEDIFYNHIFIHVCYFPLSRTRFKPVSSI